MDRENLGRQAEHFDPEDRPTPEGGAVFALLLIAAVTLALGAVWAVTMAIQWRLMEMAG